VTASVGRALAGVAYATLADAGKELAPPITFEAEAEKPVRASRSKKDPEAAAAIAEPEEEAEPFEPELPEVEESEVAPAEGEASVGAQPKKKRTRRGTRGGRARKKPAAAANDDAGQEAEDESVNGRPAPRIHVPSPDLEVAATDAVVEAPAETTDDIVEVEAVGVDGQPKKKRSRRGSRGGRKRRKPAVNGAEEAPASDEPGEAEPVADTAPAYVPMSEWIEDFDSAKRS
jgi:ribonuclease E